jgi:hypothetical protein
MPESDDTKGLQERLGKARQEFQASVERQQKLEKINSLLTLGIVVLVVGFLVAGYYKIKANFAPEQVQQSLVTHGPEVMSQVFEAVTTAASEVVPVYYQEIQVQSVDAMPRLAVAVEKEATALGDSATQKLNTQLEEALKEVHTTQQQALRQIFPDLTEEQSKALVDQIMGTVEEELHGMTGQILASTVGEIAQLDKTVKAFDTKGLPNDEAELSRLMVHHLLGFLDEELMAMRLEKVPAPKPATTPAKGGN